MIDRLELTHLRTLDALERCGTISAAAERLGVSQQAVSLQLKKIRTVLGDPLFVRTGHGMAPTPYARLIAPQVARILAQLHALPLPSALAPAQVERTLVISATDYTQKVIVADLLRDLREHAPKVRVAVTGIEVSALARKMQQGEIDLCFAVDGQVAPGLVAEPLFVEQYRCVTGDHALAERALAEGGVLPLARLAERDFIVTSPGGAHLRGSADDWFERQGLARRVAVSVPTFFMALEYLRASDMVGFIPARLLLCDGLVEIALPKYPPGYGVVAACHPSARQDPFMDWLLGRIKARFSPGMPLVSATSQA